MEEPQPFTWTCHVCGDERPDEKVAVAKHKHTYPTGVEIEENVRYCSDRAECERIANLNGHPALSERRVNETLRQIISTQESTIKIEEERISLAHSMTRWSFVLGVEITAVVFIVVTLVVAII